MRKVKVAVTQMKNRGRPEDNIAAADHLVRGAAEAGANIVLLQEMMESNYFYQKMLEANIPPGTAVEDNPAVKHFKKVATELKMVILISFFEKAGQARYNSLAVIDADGRVLGVYRKSHLPDGPQATARNFFSTSATPVLKFGKPGMAK